MARPQSFLNRMSSHNYLSTPYEGFHFNHFAREMSVFKDSNVQFYVGHPLSVVNLVTTQVLKCENQYVFSLSLRAGSLVVVGPRETRKGDGGRGEWGEEK